MIFHPFRAIVYALYYKTSGTGSAPECPDFESDFLSSLQAAITLRTSTGGLLSVSLATEADLLVRSSTFNLHLQSSAPIPYGDIAVIQTAIPEQWQTATSGKLANTKYNSQFY